MNQFDQTPILGSIVSVRYMKFDFHKQYWAEVKTVGGGKLRARLCPEDLRRFEFEGYDTSTWSNRRCHTVTLDMPIEASFTHNGVVWELCEVIITRPLFDPIETETHEEWERVVAGERG